MSSLIYEVLFQPGYTVEYNFIRLWAQASADLNSKRVCEQVMDGNV